MSARSRAAPWWLDGEDRPSVASVTMTTMEAGAEAALGRFRRLMDEIAARGLWTPRFTNADPAPAIIPWTGAYAGRVS